jgi:hypothetical protein
MARRIIVILVLIVLALLILGVILSALQKTRLNASLAASQNNLRELALFAHVYVNPTEQPPGASFPREIPPGTVVLPDVPPHDRLSWAVYMLPALNPNRQDLESLQAQIDQHQPWTAETNQKAARTPVVALICPGVQPQVDAGSPAITCYVGISGLAPPDPATIALPEGLPPPPNAGAFRYDAATPFDRILDGLSQTLLMGETADDPGPWLRGGRSTLRGLDNARDAKPLIGVGGQFGGYFPAGGHFAMCDGSVRLITPQVLPGVLLRLASIADGQGDVPID